MISLNNTYSLSEVVFFKSMTINSSSKFPLVWKPKNDQKQLLANPAHNVDSWCRPKYQEKHMIASPHQNVDLWWSA